MYSIAEMKRLKITSSLPVEKTPQGRSPYELNGYTVTRDREIPPKAA